MEIDEKVFKKISPNEYFIILFVSMKKNIKEMLPLIDKEEISFLLKKLENEKFIKIGENNCLYIREKGLDLINKKHKPEDVEILADEYRSYFRKTAPGAIGDRNVLITNLKKFVSQNPQYSFKHILKAISLYVKREKDNNNYRYLQKSHFTVYKSGESRLLSLCEDLVDTEEEYNQRQNFYEDI
jgi:predicted methyltransferase